MLTSIDYFAGKLYSSPFEEKRSTIGDIIYSFTFSAIGAITFSATNIPAINAMGVSLHLLKLPIPFQALHQEK